MHPNHEVLANNAIRISIVGVLAILALFLFAETVSAVQGFTNPTTPPADTITVNGTGQAALAPDIAHITFTVQQSAATVAAAQAAATKQANAAIAYVAGQGIASADVTTESYNISPQYSNVTPPPCNGGELCPAYIGSNQQTITGYEVDETVQVTVRDLTKVSALLAGLGSQGVENVNGPDFALSDPAAGTDAARAAAITNAKQQAQILASQLGVHLGNIVSFSDNSGGGIYPQAYAMAGNAASTASAPTPNIPAGQNTYSDSVSITYAIH